MTVEGAQLALVVGEPGRPVVNVSKPAENEITRLAPQYRPCFRIGKRTGRPGRLDTNNHPRTRHQNVAMFTDGPIGAGV